MRVAARTVWDRRETIVRVTVSGLPDGTTVRLSASVDRGNVWAWVRGACSRSGEGYTCTVSPRSGTFVFGNNSANGATMTFSVTTPDGWSDPDPGNNTVTVRGRGR